MLKTCAIPGRSLFSLLLCTALVAGCGGEGNDVTTTDNDLTTPDSDGSTLTLNAISGPLKVTLQWTGADPVHLLHSSDEDCGWHNYSLCEASGMVPGASGGQHVLTKDDHGLEPDREYYFVAEAHGFRTKPVKARVLPAKTDSLLLREAATMEPGEWRNLAELTTWPGKDSGTSFFNFQRVSGTAKDGSGGADGIGWTQRLVYHKGALMVLAMRDQAPVALFGMDPDGTWWRKDTWKQIDGEWVEVNEMEGWVGGGWSGASGGRRPFNRLTQDATHLYFSRTVGTGSKEEHGRTYRTPLDNPGVFEDSGHHGFGQSNIDTVGNHAILWVEEWGRFYGYTNGGRIWTRKPEDPGWTDLGRTPYDGTCRASGYAGEIAHNPVKDELIFIGGQSFGSPPGCGTKWVRLREPLGEIEALPDLPEINGHQLYYTSAQNKILVDPRDGAYLLQVGREKIYRSADPFSQWTLYTDLYADADRPFWSYDAFAPFALIPGTDVFVFVSHGRGVVLHRLQE